MDTRLRPVEPRDLEVTRAARGDWAIARETIGRPFPITEANEQEWYASLGNGRFPELAVWAITTADGTAIGLVQITGIDWLHRTAWFGIWIVPDSHGNGHGTSATTMALERAHRWMNLRQVRLHVAADNATAIATYAKTGWVEEGRLVGAVLEGSQQRDLIVMRHDAP